MKTMKKKTLAKKQKRNFKNQSKIVLASVLGLCMIMSFLFSMSSCCCLPTVNSLIEEKIESCLLSTYDEVGTKDLDITELEENVWEAKGTVLVYDIDYQRGIKKAIECEVEYRIEYKDDTYKIVSENIKSRKEVPSKNATLEAAISKINKNDALEMVEDDLKSRLKNPSSYKRNNYSITAEYDIFGNVIVYVDIDYSAQNGFGGMNRDIYRRTLKCNAPSYSILTWY